MEIGMSLKTMQAQSKKQNNTLVINQIKEN